MDDGKEDIVSFRRERAMTALPSNLINQPADKQVLARLRSPQTLTAGKNWNSVNYILQRAPDVSSESTQCYTN